MKHGRQVPPRSYAAQPKIAAIVRLLKRKRGVTAAEVAKVLGWNDASIRAVFSRLEQQGAEITRRKERGRGGAVYPSERKRIATRQPARSVARNARQEGLCGNIAAGVGWVSMDQGAAGGL